MVAIVSPDHRLAGASTGLAALRDETLVSRDRVNVDRREIERLLTSAKITPGARLLVSSLEAAKQCVAAGLGVAFVPGISAARDLARGDLAEVHIDVPLPTIGYHLVHRRGAGTSDLTGRLLQSLRATSRRLP